MKLTFDPHLAAKYKSASQKARVLTEQWVDQSVYCPNCGWLNIDKYPNNQPVADFFCPNCKEDYELKSKQDNIGTKILDGAYDTKIERLRSFANPNLFILSYDLQKLCVVDFFVIPKHFFTPEIIEKRSPLSINARRAGWIGSNILLQKVPQSGKIFLIKRQRIVPREKVLAEWEKTLFLREKEQISARGWLIDIMRCIERLGVNEFTLDDIYAYENELKLLHPNNRYIRAKIRQQLQILRDRGYINFESRGYYRLT